MIAAFRPPSHRFLNRATLGAVHMPSFRVRMLSFIPGVVQYIIPMTSGVPSAPFCIILLCFLKFCLSLSHGFNTDVPPLPKYCKPWYFSSYVDDPESPYRFLNGRIPWGI